MPDTPYREHVTDGGPCWCLPCKFVVCSECRDQETGGCWKCAGEKYPGLLPAAEIDEEPFVVVHNDPEAISRRLISVRWRDG